ncbi:MAG TPA: hypothetical protein VGN88_10410, partial [Phycisphaerae bacterium]
MGAAVDGETTEVAGKHVKMGHRQFPQSRYGRRGFSLIQVTMLLAVAGVLMVAMLPGGQYGSEGDKSAITIKRMEAIEDATRAFMAANG